MLYAFDVTIPTAPLMKWRVGCTNSALTDTASCINSAGAASSDFAQMGQTWSTPTVARIKGFSTDPNRPVVIVGGGYDTCDDQDAKPNTACTGAGYTRRGNRVYVIDADTGSRLASFATDGSVPADITVIDRDFDGMVDYSCRRQRHDGRNLPHRLRRPGTLARVHRRRGRLPRSARPTLSMHGSSCFRRRRCPRPARSTSSVASGDRERPLITNYPYPTVPSAGVLNRAYMLVDSFATTGLPVNLDDTTVMENFTSGSTCTTPSAEALARRAGSSTECREHHRTRTRTSASRGSRPAPSSRD